jgi:hypothetical protein
MNRVIKTPSVIAALILLVAAAWVLITNSGPIVNGHRSYLVLYIGSMLVAGGTIAFAVVRRERSVRLWLSVLAAVPLVILAAAGLWLSPFGATDVALDAMNDSGTVAVSESSTAIVMVPKEGDAQLGVVFYPGARVDARAYAHLLRPVAQAGYQVVIVKEPLGIAFLSTGFAATWVESHPEVETWVVSGHSLGGVVASSNADAEPDLAGLMLWASFPATDISDAAISATSIFGTDDGLTTPEKIEESVPDLPSGTVFVPIEGAIHSYFGDYGLQSGDGVAGVPRDVAQAEIVEAALRFLSSMR